MRLCLGVRRLLRVTQLVEGLAVDAGDVGDVLGRFEPPFNLQRGHADTNQIRQDFQPGEVLRAEQVLPVAERDELAVGHQLERHAAGLRALAAIGRTAAERLARQTLAGVSDAERAMDENLQRE